MMKTWKITAMKVGYIESSARAVMRYSRKEDPLITPIWCIGATDGIHKVIIDTGVDDLECVHRFCDPMIRQDCGMETLAVLNRILGWKAEDVDIVINTHLHFDHCGCNRYFTRAQFYVQKKEYESAFEPPKSIAHLYHPCYFDKRAVSYFNWKLLDGETEVLPGLVCLPTPGHTYGHQSVLIHTNFGTVCAAGDVSSIAENINTDTEPGITLDTQEVLESFHKIRIRADYIIPGHEPGIIDGEKRNFPYIQ